LLATPDFERCLNPTLPFSCSTSLAVGRSADLYYRRIAGSGDLSRWLHPNVPVKGVYRPRLEKSVHLHTIGGCSYR